MGLERRLIALFATSIAALFYIAVGANIVPTALKHDFLNLYTGATLARAGDYSHLHDPVRQFEIETRIVPELPAVVPFVRIPAYAALIAPLAALPIRAAFWCWVGLQVAVLLACWWWAAWRFGANGLIWSSVFLPTAYGIANGQDCAILLLLMIVAFELAERGWLFWGGFAIGMTLFKFHLLLLFPVMMAAGRRWRMLGGYAAAAGIQLSGSLMVGGVAGLAAYAQMLGRKDIERLSPSPEMMANIHALPLNFGFDSWISRGGLAILVLGMVILAARQAPLWRWFAAGASGSLLIAPHVYEYDVALLLLPILLAIFTSTSPWVRYTAMAAAIPVPYWMTAAHAPWAAAPSLVILMFLGSLGLVGQPFQAAAGLPPGAPRGSAAAGRNAWPHAQP